MKITRRHGLVLAAGSGLVAWSPGLLAQSGAMDGLWLSDSQLPGGTWQWTLRRDGDHWVGDVERQLGALPPKRWRLRARAKGVWWVGVLEREAGTPSAQVRFRQIGAERLQVEWRWPDGLQERAELIRP